MERVKVLIRPYEAADFETITALWHKSKRQAFSYVNFQQTLTLQDDRVYFRDSLMMRCKVWVAEQEHRLVGFMAINGDYLDQLFIAVDHQRQGIGLALLNKAKALSPAGLRLHTFQRNKPARAFYEREGFKSTLYGVSAAPELEPDVEYQWRPA